MTAVKILIHQECIIWKDVYLSEDFSGALFVNEIQRRWLHCGRAHGTAASTTGIPRGLRVESQPLHFRLSFLLTLLGKQQKWVQGPGSLPMRVRQKLLARSSRLWHGQPLPLRTFGEPVDGKFSLSSISFSL